jgi:hypothetical protein
MDPTDRRRAAFDINTTLAGNSFRSLSLTVILLSIKLRPPSALRARYRFGRTTRAHGKLPIELYPKGRMKLSAPTISLAEHLDLANSQKQHTGSLTPFALSWDGSFLGIPATIIGIDLISSGLQDGPSVVSSIH